MTSVILPNYNYARFLKTRIEGILSQTCQDFELIMLDDASTDDSREVIERYRGHPKVTHIVYNDRNSGSVFRQWNKGVALAKGEYVWIAEADDDAEPALLQTLAELLDRHPHAGIAYGHSELIDSAGNRTGSAHEFLSVLGRDWRQSFYRNGREEIAGAMGFLNCIPNASAVVFRHQAYLQAGPAMPELRSTGDWMQWFRILKNWDVAYCAETLNLRRNHPDSVTASTLKSVSGLTDYLSVWQETRPYLDATGRLLLLERLTADLLLLRQHPNTSIRTLCRILTVAWRVEPRAVRRSLPALVRCQLLRSLRHVVVAILGEERMRAMKRTTRRPGCHPPS
jgi:glycosyltransferase involved in cell wall biosynthesis